MTSINTYSNTIEAWSEEILPYQDFGIDNNNNNNTNKRH